MAKSFSHDSQFYDNAPVAKKWKRSVFPIRPERATNFTSFNLGDLVPLYKPIRVLPHDTFVFDLASMIRMSNPLIAPIMDGIDFDVYAFYTPDRLAFDGTKEIYGQNSSAGARQTEVVYPSIDPYRLHYVDGTFDSVTSGNPLSDVQYQKTIASHLGIPKPSVTSASVNNTPINIVPLRDVYLIWDWYFRDQNLQNEFIVDTSSTGYPLVAGQSAIGSMAFAQNGAISYLLKAAKKHDFFTSMLPYAEKVATPLTIPLGNTAPVHLYNPGTGSTLGPDAVISPVGPGTGGVTPPGTDVASWKALPVGGGTSYGTVSVYADLKNATSASITTLRETLDLDQLYQVDAMAGTRYDEQIFAHFGARPNAESFKPQIIGECHFKINVDQVLAHAGSASETLGDTGAYSLTGNRTHLVSQSFTEPGYIIILGVARQNVHIYSQGLDAEWTKLRRFDQYYPEFQDVGMITRTKGEIYFTGVKAQDSATFGFAEYGQEYRVFTPMVTGILNPNVTNSLDFWTLGDELPSNVSLSGLFIEEDMNNLKRALSDQKMDQFIGRFGLSGTMTRVVSLHSVPRGL